MQSRRRVLAAVLAVLALWGGCAGRLARTEAAAARPVRADAFTFVVLGDNRPHMGAADPITQPPPFLRNIEEINRLDPDFVIDVGDLIRGYVNDEKLLNQMWDGFEKAVARFTVPYYQVIGNHDVSTELMQQLYLKRYGNRFPLYYSFNHKGCHFIVLDSDLHGQYQNITGEQLTWLKRDLEEYGRMRTFVFLHQPLFFGYEKQSNWAAEVHPLLKQYKVDTVFAGHEHMYEKCPTLDGIRYIISGGAGAETGTSEVLGDFYHYCVVTVRGDKVSIAVVPTGHIESETIVTEDTFKQAESLGQSAFPLVLKIPRGSTEAPGEMKMTAQNTFDRPFEGKLEFVLAEGSPWKVQPTSVQLALAPGEKKELTYNISCDRPVTDELAKRAVPRYLLSGTIGGRVLWKPNIGNQGPIPQPIGVDLWPYRDARQALAANATPPPDIPAGTQIAAKLQMPQTNPLDEPLLGTLTWVFPEGSKWQIEPAGVTVRLPAKGKETVTFDIRFQGNFEDFPRSPMVRSVYFAGKDKVYEQAREPLRFKDLKPFAIANRASATAPRAAQPPKVDGKLDDAVWQKAPAPTRFVSLGCSDVVAHQTEVRLLYDADHLYMAIRCHEPELSKLVIRAQENSGRVYKDDSVEIYISPENKPDAPTYRITLNADAAADVALAGDSKIQRAAGREDAAWTLELAIPWAAVGATTPAPGKQLALQVCRTRRIEPVEYGTWSPCVGGYSKSQHFGTLVLGE